MESMWQIRGAMFIMLNHARPIWLCWCWSRNQQDFRNNVIDMNSVLIFSIILSETFNSRRIQRYIIINVRRSSCRVPVIFFFFRILTILKSDEQISVQISKRNFTKICQLEAEMISALCRDVDIQNYSSTLRNIVEAECSTQMGSLTWRS
jgi:hypothetical protein